jgi:hypothetical protein
MGIAAYKCTSYVAHKEFWNAFNNVEDEATFRRTWQKLTAQLTEQVVWQKTVKRLNKVLWKQHAVAADMVDVVSTINDYKYSKMWHTCRNLFVKLIKLKE